MNNASMNHFAQVDPGVNIGRSKFDRPNRHLTTMYSGMLVPVYWDEILPGDTVSFDVGTLIRMSTPIVPVMDSAFVDVHAYFVPNRLLWSKWEEFCGANKSSYWSQTGSFTPPLLQQINGVKPHSIADYMGIPTGITGSGNYTKISQLPFLAYCRIWNDWFRDENVMAPCNDVNHQNGQVTTMSKVVQNYASTATTSGSYYYYIHNGDYVSKACLGDACLPVAKFHDYFTSALPEPQKGTPVGIGLTGALPVKNSGNGQYAFAPKWYSSVGASATTMTGDLMAHGSYGTGYKSNSDTPTGTAYAAMEVDLGQASMITINALRQAFAVQRFLEKSARGGTRYIEILQSFFGVRSSDASLQRAQFLGGKRIPINMTQVAQTSSTSGSNALGQLGAFSQTLDGDHLFTKSFEEHGILIVVAAIRTARSYQQGIRRGFSRTQMTDYYWPTFANLGEMPVRRKEIYADNTTGNDEAVFGYQEAWAEYRYSPDQVSGQFRSNIAGGYDKWHYADEYASAPTLTIDWMREPQAPIERTLAVTGQPHFLADFSFKSTWVRPMPVFSVPGLIDHH